MSKSYDRYTMEISDDIESETFKSDSFEKRKIYEDGAEDGDRKKVIRFFLLVASAIAVFVVPALLNMFDVIDKKTMSLIVLPAGGVIIVFYLLRGRKSDDF